MSQQFFHGNLEPADIARALLGEFDRGNFRAQALGESNSLMVQIGTRPGAGSGGQTALTVTIQKIADGVTIQLGEQEWLGTAASLGWTALSALRNPLTFLGRLDDLAQDVENLQLTEHVWNVINQTVDASGASHPLSQRLSPIACEFCGTANPVGQSDCLACGAPMGKAQRATCRNCGFAVQRAEARCPNCGTVLRL